MITIRQATTRDLPRVVELSALWAAENITYGLAANSEEGTSGYMGDYFWVAEVDSDVIGYITGSVHESEGLAVIAKGELYLEVDEVYVHPAHRNGTIGHRLVDNLLQTAEGSPARSCIPQANNGARSSVSTRSMVFKCGLCKCTVSREARRAALAAARVKAARNPVLPEQLGLRVTGYGLRVTGYGLRVTGYGLRVSRNRWLHLLDS